MPENQRSGKTEIEQRLCKLMARVRAAELLYNREPESVQILPVSKMRSAEEIAAVISLNLPGIGDDFGENYVQEAVEKIAQLEKHPLSWHFIGPVQSNKTQTIARSFQWVHSVGRLKIAQRLSDQRPANLPALNVCLQVNISSETSKSGVSLTELPALAAQVADLPNLQLRGLMAIPAASGEVTAQRAAFALLREVFDSLRVTQNMPVRSWDTLSMGMSGDLEAAIAEGATMVRIGTDIFGSRGSKDN